jgi:hypothetical protein
MRSLSTLALGALLLASSTPGSALAASYGDLVITEMMIATPSGTDDWFEVYNASGAPVDLTGCSVMEYSCSSGEVNAKAITACDSCSTSIAPGEFAIFGSSKPETQPCVGYTDPASKTCDYPVDFGAPSVFLSYGTGLCGDDYLSIECAGVMLDEVLFDWEDVAGRCPLASGKGCSAFVLAGQVDADANDNWPGAWGISDATAVFYDEQRLLTYGTPGFESSGGEVQCPDEGTLVFTELMVDPMKSDSSEFIMPDWFEIMNAGAETVDLKGMSFRYFTPDENGDPASRVESFTVASTFEIAPGEARVFTYKTCLDGTEATEMTCAAGEYVETGFDFSKSGVHRVEVACLLQEGGERVVDFHVFDELLLNLETGHSLIFDPTGLDDPASSNDSSSAWCMAGFDLLCIESEGACNYGSPGEITPCTTEILAPPSGPACRCGVAGGPWSWGSATLLTLLAAFSRRRRSDPA